MRWLLVLIGLLISPLTLASEADIRAVLAQQQAAWNRADIEGYMQGYWHSEQLRFVSSGKIKYGWDNTLKGYQARYPDAATMGKLLFELETVQMLSEDAALVVGRWQLLRKKDQPAGEFTLIFKKIGDNWRIVHDHTS
ncbi:DUF4440 domain-containing protein [Ferrimonas sp. SCSIO 43195]|uniref:YybH family protein n=1 Tax=Ferrimonas sp. SCSIO 43195 TaxID=2822844 RepID=UPI0020753782|nr:DUF4440 domain-containing protein [Ferrimonas sp. SCSIO 43195]USD37569.1 DUF4440 domain-containing protein [Ferrimonas sp. SCSIO 43195]